MALVTRCPDCATAFRVTPLHLRAHCGDVRCGQCAQVFNGFTALAMVREPEELDLAGAEVGETPESTPEIPFQHDSNTLAASSENSSPSVPAYEITLDNSISGDAAQTVPASSDTPLVVEESISQREGETSSGSGAASAKEEHQTGEHLREAAIPQSENHVPEDYASGNQAFAEVPPSRAFAAWSIASFFLIVVLGAQAVYLYRVGLSVSMPATKPYLEQYCKLLGCTIPSPQYANSLNVESSDMQPDTQHPGVSTLSATIRNNASLPQAFPSFQLTLIDLQDRPLASRTFPPDAYLEEAARRAKVVAPNAEFNVRLQFDSGELNAAGYRLSLLYPRS